MNPTMLYEELALATTWIGAVTVAPLVGEVRVTVPPKAERLARAKIETTKAKRMGCFVMDGRVSGHLLWLYQH